MARIFPFRALRYDPSRVRLADVVTQPYDKITPAMQDAYYAAHPCNLVRIELGKAEERDGGGHNVYTRAAACFRAWRRQGILQQDAEPGVYVYAQKFAEPGTAGTVRERRGVIVLGQLEDYEREIIFRHEQTHTGPKADRLNLLRATRAHFGQLFLLYSDPAGEIDAQLDPEGEPALEVCDEYEVRHRLWPVTSAETIAAVCRLMEDKKLILADGHHRYETALAYRNERRAHPGGASCWDAPYERVMMTLVNMESEGLVILPTHRVIHGLERFHTEELLRGAQAFFDVAGAGALDAEQALDLLAAAGREGTALLAMTAGGAFLLRARPAEVERALAEFSPRQRRLDVVQLHALLVERVLGISEEAVRAQKHLSYFRDAGEAMARVRQGANVAFLMNPVPMAQVRDVALAGEVLPQKSTDFYPKLLSGLTIYALD